MKIRHITTIKHSFHIPAVSLNACPAVLRALLSLGCDRFVCANKAELAAALDAGVSPEAVLIDAPALTKGLLKAAAAEGVEQVAFRSVGDVRRIAKVIAEAR